MKPVDQTVFEDGKGNCLAACVASILELPIEVVPNFAEHGFLDGVRAWLKQLGFELVRVYPTGEASIFANAPAIVAGWSPRGGGKQHAVVGRSDSGGLEVLHDPHPSRAGIIGEPIVFAWIVNASIQSASSVI